MLEVADTSREYSYSYLYHPLSGEDFEASFTFLPDLLERDVCFLRVSGVVDLFSLHATKDGGIKVKSANLPLYPGNYPSYLSYPTPRTTYPAQSVGSYPAYSKLESVVLPRSSSAIEMSLYFSRNELEGRVEVYANPVNGEPSGSAFHGSLRWADSPISRFDIGCISARETPYNLKFSNLEVRGEISKGNWYYISGFDGFKTSEPRWQGAIDPDDESTYTSYTDLINLARYDYARPEQPVDEAYGLNWRI